MIVMRSMAFLLLNEETFQKMDSFFPLTSNGGSGKEAEGGDLEDDANTQIFFTFFFYPLFCKND